MSITDELREYAGEFYLFRYKDVREKLDAIADRIDIAHKHAIGYVDDRDPETMAENGWVKLPMDADGEYIHIGDVMAYEDNTKPLEVIALVPPAVFLTKDGPRYANMCRHYVLTVEDVLREFGRGWHEQMNGPDTFDVADYVERYAAKLRLADDGREQQ